MDVEELQYPVQESAGWTGGNWGLVELGVISTFLKDFFSVIDKQMCHYYYVGCLFMLT